MTPRWKHWRVALSRTIQSCGALVEARSALPSKRSSAVRPSASIPADLPATPPHARPALPAEDDPAVIVLSSGTTSVAKGVVHTHRGFIENARTNLYMYQGVLPRDRSLVPLSTAFIGCYNGWFPFLNAGACTIFMEHFDLDELPRRVSAERATHVFLTPTLLAPDPQCRRRERELPVRSPHRFCCRADGRNHAQTPARTDQPQHRTGLWLNGDRRCRDQHHRRGDGWRPAHQRRTAAGQWRRPDRYARAASRTRK